MGKPLRDSRGDTFSPGATVDSAGDAIAPGATRDSRGDRLMPAARAVVSARRKSLRGRKPFGGKQAPPFKGGR